VNYLAHIYLARPEPDAMLGGLLGDFVFGMRGPDAWPEPIRAEILRHRAIDRFTDAHPAVVAARARFPDGRRRYAGIALDVFFDHCLARDWSRWCDEPLADFTARFYAHLLATAPRLPERLRGLAPPMAAHDWLGSYRHRASVDRAVTRIATRLSRNGERLVACLDDLRANEDALARSFDAFFPDLVAWADSPASRVDGRGTARGDA
jgi:acyl carrier protein phosphodiesterase